ncbi:peptidoglycan recognition protein family protein [Akkermansiaceae bacterium]|nr:peptidoglycan recognition protein family protein [Akkermansiaceae bacterium]
MELDPSTIRWKIKNKPASLTRKEVDYLSDLIAQELGYQSPDKGSTLSHTTVKEKSVRTPTSDPYKDVYARSPNQSTSIKPVFIMVHDSYGSHDGSKSWILQRKSGVSYHWLIDALGNRTQFVDNLKKAWHAGRSYFKGYNGLNSYAIGVAFWGNSHERTVNFKEIDSMARLIIRLMKKYRIKRENIITHAQAAPNRKTDTSEKVMKKLNARIDQLLK